MQNEQIEQKYEKINAKGIETDDNLLIFRRKLNTDS
jgi:hypothetical protein